MKVRLSNEQLQDLTGRLIGTARPLDEAVKMIGYTYEQLDDSTLQSLETLAFFCSLCERWKPIEDLLGASVCGNCYVHQCWKDFPPDQDEIICSDVFAEYQSTEDQEEI